MQRREKNENDYKKWFLASLLLSAVLLAALSAYAAPLYFPHVDTSLPWQMEIAVINTGGSTPGVSISYDVNTRIATQKTAGGDVPPSLTNAAYTSDGTKIWQIGGQANGTSVRDTYEYNILTNRWR
jgi:hypothetical protein